MRIIPAVLAEENSKFSYAILLLSCVLAPSQLVKGRIFKHYEGFNLITPFLTNRYGIRGCSLERM